MKFSVTILPIILGLAYAMPSLEERDQPAHYCAGDGTLDDLHKCCKCSGGKGYCSGDACYCTKDGKHWC
ncbi:hypothetical protein EYZ11_010782 [Aspergillus tanneri]|uniref:Invertebrate defensins family profile domain-containing protein n=1 Tax=Aspergillus tanneri TaxID=1220188 RepID=A0A4S3J9W2_9EURO|nr:hypothetical protein EYZ11_010782 [Aspergillus tanneri]